MTKGTIQDILPLVERPSRYLGSEINRIKKDHGKVKLRIALVYPELYEIGTSHFGIQILYHILNQHPEVVAERVFCPAADMKELLKEKDIPLVSLETHTPLSRFDIVGFSLLYELNYTNVLSILELGKIPFFSSEREETHPIIIAGGPCTSNPEPIADFFDAIVVGEGESVVGEMAQIWLEGHSGNATKKEILNRWYDLEGVYIPGFFYPVFDERGYQTLVSRTHKTKTIHRRIEADLNLTPFPSQPIVPYGKPVHDRLRLEISRGCTRGCRFCQAGMIYRPVRERTPQLLFDLAQNGLAGTGYEDISLLSLSTGDYRSISYLIKRLMGRCEIDRTAVSLPSLRVETLSPELMELIKKVRKTGFTIAPEAGSQRLREMINKPISEKEIMETVESAFLLGWRVIKLYFMVGFPSETEDDIQGIVRLIKALKKNKGIRNRKAQINVSVATFIPKPHTPFQWASQLSLEESKEKIFWLQEHLRLPGVHFKWQHPEVSLLEGLWARGDRRLNPLLSTAHLLGCEYDGWTDFFNFGKWESALKKEEVDISFYTTRRRELWETLPWDHIDTGVTKAFLHEEWEKATLGHSTADCRDGKCQDCGVCDQKEIRPQTYRLSADTDIEKDLSVKTTEENEFEAVKIAYSKTGDAKYFGHLELVNIFIRAIRRAGIPVQFTKGFHPKTKISFEDSLPIGMESLCENLFLRVSKKIAPRNIVAVLNKQLPEGIFIRHCGRFVSGGSIKMPKAVEYRVELMENCLNRQAIESFLRKPEVLIHRRAKKGKVAVIDLREAVVNILMPSPNQVQMMLKPVNGKTLRPFDVMAAVFNMDQNRIKTAKITKIRQLPLEETNR